MRFTAWPALVALAVVSSSGLAAAQEKDPKPNPPAQDPNAPKPLGKPGEGPGPSAGQNGPKTGLTESDSAKPQSNPWAKAGVSSKDGSSRPSGASSWGDAKRPGSASAASSTGFEVGGRLGFALASGTGFGEAYGGAVPIILDIGYRIVPALYVGLYGQFGFVFVSSKSCPGNASCSAQDYRFGLNAHVQFPIGPSYFLWFGAGAGYEILHDSRTADPISLSSTFSGLELFNGTFGFDFVVDPQTRVGPFIGTTFGKFSSVDVSVEGSNSLKGGTQDLEDTTVHSWLMLGVRGVYGL